MNRVLGLLVIGIVFLSQCKDGPKDQPKDDPPKEVFKYELQFDQDSAYSYVEKQVSFGPRVPGTIAHGITANYLLKEMRRLADTAFIQFGEMQTDFEGRVEIKNIIASIDPEKKNRILLCAHWDTRPEADEDPDRPNEPADGANDGASGVGVLMEVARQLAMQPARFGVDIIFFDAEDMGQTEAGQSSWCLGSQYWAENKHEADYQAKYGILLDMVGAKDAVFAFERNSLNQAEWFVKHVWRVASSIGHGKYFLPYPGGYITDDHIYVSRVAGIPTIDIIHYDIGTGSGFGDFWHTHKDNMDGISAATLNAVGETVLKTIYEERP